MRGRADKLKRDLTSVGNTPASAGKSSLRTIASITGWKYPRECGEEVSTLDGAITGTEIPPRVRGRGIAVPQSLGHTGNTPASAGKRAFITDPAVLGRKYPANGLQNPPSLDKYNLAKTIIYWGNGLSPASQDNRRQVLRDYYSSFNYTLSQAEENLSADEQ